MMMSSRLRRVLLLQSWSFILLLGLAVGLIAALSLRYDHQMDVTAAGRHTLAEATLALLQELKEPVVIEVFTRDVAGGQIRQRISDLVSRYQQHYGKITLTFVDPDTDPQRVRASGISRDGELLVKYGERSENLTQVGEQGLTNTLQRLARAKDRRVVVVAGHGERSVEKGANHDLSQWAEGLRQKGFTFTTVNLTTDLQIDDQVALLMLASPRVELLPGEIELLQKYVNSGGNLFWLRDPDDKVALPSLEEALGIHFAAGTVVDPTGQMIGIDNPAIVVVADYADHAVTRQMNTLTLFPLVSPLTIDMAGEALGWQAEPLLQTLDRSWAEEGELRGTIQQDLYEQAGPLTLAVALQRPRPEARGDNGESIDKAHEQRVIVVGDGDFFSNTYLGNGDNQALADRMLNWLATDDNFIQIPPRRALDMNLTLTPMTAAMIGYGFLLLLPLLLISAGVGIWMKRRRR
ncbi:MAG: GldG family protein [Gammaproteobacteria bacterium]|nr:GldG family protein [Gammaproteobacteria bacterium]